MIQKVSGAPPLYEGNGIFIDRELSWLAFNRRVLEQAQDPSVPLLERAKFLGIVAGNLDEFFEVRVAALLQRAESGVVTDGIAQLDIQEKLRRVLAECQEMVRRQYRCWEEVQTLLRGEGVAIKKMAELNAEEAAFLELFFRREVYHLLTPITVDPAHPFPRVLNKALCLALLLRGPSRGRDSLGVLTIPRGLPRVVALPPGESGRGYVFISDVVQHYAGELFKGYPIRACAPFRATRNSNLYLDESESGDEDEGGNLLQAVEAEVHNRRKGDVVRLEIDEHASAKLVDLLARNLDVEPAFVFRTGNPVNLNRLMALYGLITQPRLKFPPYLPVVPPGFEEPEEIFARLRARDVLLHHPFESFDPVVHFIETAARDPRVLAIKTTLYRTSADSPIMYTLMEAAERGKEVVVVVELKARFDEQSNIHWARQLEERGGTVVYGLVGLKTHCKLSLVIRREEAGFRRYAHTGTGNYNPDTARLYTDLSLLTSDRALTEGISEVFNFLTANAKDPDFRGLMVSPVSFLADTLAAIRREEENARQGLPAGIFAKLNALMDTEVIEALYRASSAGVPVRLIVRGICALRPGAPGLSENIRVKSVVGRYLEHSRIFCFRNGGQEEVYVGSGDWMARNLRERVEVLAPVRDPQLRLRLLNLLSAYWCEDACTYWMGHDGGYAKVPLPEGRSPWNAQTWSMSEASGAPDLREPPALWE